MTSPFGKAIQANFLLTLQLKYEYCSPSEFACLKYMGFEPDIADRSGDKMSYVISKSNEI